MNAAGEYEVIGERRFRGHEHGERFVARLEPLHEARAVRRGDIRLLERIEPDLRPGSYTLPDGWERLAEPGHGAARRLSTIGR